jgi:hypothetical protein
VGINYFYQPLVGNYELRIKYANGSLRKSFIEFKSPCADNANRAVASVGDGATQSLALSQWITLFLLTLCFIIVISVRHKIKK